MTPLYSFFDEENVFPQAFYCISFYQTKIDQLQVEFGQIIDGLKFKTLTLCQTLDTNLSDYDWVRIQNILVCVRLIGLDSTHWLQVLVRFKT